MDKSAIQQWEELNIVSATLTFTCGGDSMGDMGFEFFDANGNPVISSDLSDFFQDEVFNHIDFYVNSDGHYLGESGTVEITLEDGEFQYLKSSESEYEEYYKEVAKVPLSKEELNFINKNVASISETERGSSVIYVDDLILTDEDIELQNGILEQLYDFACDFQHSAAGNSESYDEFGIYTWNKNDYPISDDDETIRILIERSYRVFKDE